MKTLVLLRHAKSSHDLENLNDINRQLNRRGIAEAEMMSDILSKEPLKVEKIISSPAIRAISTALVFAPQLKVKYENLEINSNLYQWGMNKILKVVQSQDDKINQLMLAGHNPDLADLVNYLIEQGIENYPTTAIAIITFDVTKWADVGHKKGKLIKLLLPEQFRSEKIQD